MSTKKAKLRTVADVISRIHWDPQHYNCILGYDDRLHGPLESPVEDFVPISKGGDLPEHRIWYIRSDELVLWDKLGRVDRLFGSGAGADAPASIDCQRLIEEAQINMERLGREKEEKRAEKEKQRRIKALRRAKLSQNRSNGDCSVTKQAIKISTSEGRFQWHEVPAHAWSRNASWDSVERSAVLKPSETKDLVFLTWNILFDIFDGELEETRERWLNLVEHLGTYHADVIALQEVTPSFVEILLASDWVKDYAASSSIKDVDTVSPSGNLTLWKRSTLSADRIEVCIDGNRRRVILTILESVTAKYAIANVHLPANRGEQKRDAARQRELSSVLSKLQRFESSKQFDSMTRRPIIMGDFNSGEETLIFGSSFVDCWRAANPESPGFTFDPKENERATRTLDLTRSKSLDRKRIDRIYMGTVAKYDLEHMHVQLIGCNDEPFSDHYGVMATIPTHCYEPPSPCMYQPSLLKNTWASNACISYDSILALVLSQREAGNNNLFDAQSSLPIPHITLLHGFIEYDGCVDMLKRSLRDIAEATTRAMPSLSLRFTPESVQVFEHQSSATLVCCPDPNYKQNAWMLRLYKALRSVFVQCHEQESRFAAGWTPHISLGKFSTATQAREAARMYADGLHGSISIDVHNMAVFKRSSDGKFYTTNVTPLGKVKQVIGKSNTTDYIANSGKSWAKSFRNISEPILVELERVVRDVVGNSIHSEVIVYGSHALGSSLPGLSDVDIVVKLTSSTSEALKSIEESMFVKMSLYIEEHFPGSEVRLRNAGHGKFQICTIRLWPGSIEIDAMLCCILNSAPISNRSHSAWQAVQDTELLLLKVGKYRSLFEGSLRIVKLWAYHRLVYGLGFPGGGGWAVWLAKVLWEQNCREVLTPQSLAALFFSSAAKQVNELPIHIAFQEIPDATPSFAVLAPHSHENHGRNSTQSCICTLQNEIQRAAKFISSEGPANSDESYLKRLEMVISPINPGFLLEFESIIVISVSNKKQLPPEVSYSVSNYILTVVVALEHKLGNPAQIRPFLKPMSLKNSLVWLIGVHKNAGLLRTFIERENVGLRCATQGGNATMECKSSIEAMSSLGLIRV